MFDRMKMLVAALVTSGLLVAGPAQADLSEILEAGTVKIAIPENFPRLGLWVPRVSTLGMTWTSQSSSAKTWVLRWSLCP